MENNIKIFPTFNIDASGKASGKIIQIAVYITFFKLETKLSQLHIDFLGETSSFYAHEITNTLLDKGALSLSLGLSIILTASIW